MGKHIADQPRERAEGTRARQFARIERERGAAGPHPASRTLQRRADGPHAEGRRTQEFLRRDRERKED